MNHYETGMIPGVQINFISSSYGHNRFYINMWNKTDSFLDNLNY